MSARAAWAGIVVADVEASADWYASTLGGSVTESADAWVKVDLPNGSCLELFAGERERVGRVFPSYGTDHGPPVLPGYAVDDPAALVEGHGLEVARSLPDWIVVTGPDRLRVVLTTGGLGRGRGLVGFRYVTSGSEDPQRAFLASIGVSDGVVNGDAVRVTPIFRARRDEQVTDPDGTTIELCR